VLEAVKVKLVNIHWVVLEVKSKNVNLKSDKTPLVKAVAALLVIDNRNQIRIVEELF